MGKLKVEIKMETYTGLARSSLLPPDGEGSHRTGLYSRIGRSKEQKRDLKLVNANWFVFTIIIYTS